jgi:hypothetical protein
VPKTTPCGCPRAAPATIHVMKLRREAGILKRKAIASLRCATKAFNSSEDDGRDVRRSREHGAWARADQGPVGEGEGHPC